MLGTKQSQNYVLHIISNFQQNRYINKKLIHLLNISSNNFNCVYLLFLISRFCKASTLKISKSCYPILMIQIPKRREIINESFGRGFFFFFFSKKFHITFFKIFRKKIKNFEFSNFFSKLDQNCKNPSNKFLASTFRMY